MNISYKEATSVYNSIVKKIKLKNTELVNSMPSKRIIKTQLKTIRSKSIFPYIPSDPKTNFLSITPINLFTKDDPILRFVPTIKNTQPTSINWYEGTIIGDTPFSATNTISILFLGSKGMEYEAGADFLVNSRICTRNDVPDPMYYRSNRKINSLESLFCGVCLLFDCGIHETHVGNMFSKHDEPSKCHCGSEDKSNGILHGFDENNDELLPRLSIKIKSNLSLRDFMDNYMFSPCVMSKLASVVFNKRIDCSVFKDHRIPPKKMTLTHSKINQKEFFQPCNHPGKCSKACPCVSRGTGCELICSCIECKNGILCSCEECNSECPCRKSGHECGIMCKCKHKVKEAQKTNEIPLKLINKTPIHDLIEKGRFLYGTNKTLALDCGNRETYLRKQKKVSICQSSFHGYGLFAEEFIRADEFVLEYTGELISDKEAERRGNFYELNKCSYLFNIMFKNDECLYSVDAFWVGNKSRYINHSKYRANISSNIVLENGKTKIIFKSIKDIYKGDELLFDYHFTEEHKKRHGIID